MIADFIIHTRARAHSLTHTPTPTHPRTTPWAESTLNPKLTADPGFRTKPWRHFASCTSVNHTASASDEQAVSACTTVKMVTVIESPVSFLHFVNVNALFLSAVSSFVSGFTIDETPTGGRAVARRPTSTGTPVRRVQCVHNCLSFRE